MPALTDIAQFRLAEEPEGRIAADATLLLQSRADLLLWLAPNRTSRLALRELLLTAEIRLSNQLLVQAEIDAFDPPVRSPAASAPAYLDREAGVLHLRSSTGRVDWAAAFRALFSEVERFCPTTEIPPLCMTAAYIMSQEDWADAEQALLAADFKAPDDLDVSFEVGRELEDELEDETTNDEPTDPAAAVTEDEDTSSGGSLDSDEIAEEEPVDVDSATMKPRSVASENAAENGSERGNAISTASGPGGSAGRRTSNEDAEESSSGEEEEDDDTYGSASSRGAFGAEPEGDDARSDHTERENTRARGRSDGQGRGGSSPFRDDGGRQSDAAAERQVRRSRMLSYVSRSGTRGDGDASTASGSDDIADLIDAAAMKAALSYEQGRGWEPERQPHFNPGFDIVSKSPTGGRRLIEVKGLDDEWTERGIKLSHVQFSMAREHPNEFWIYIVEHARDLERQKVTAIGNPFSKVEEYWFDHNWREASEERASSRDIHLKEGLKVQHNTWGKGVVVEIKSRGLIPFVVIDFGSVEGRRGIPFNSSLKILD